MQEGGGFLTTQRDAVGSSTRALGGKRFLLALRLWYKYVSCLITCHVCSQFLCLMAVVRCSLCNCDFVGLMLGSGSCADPALPW